VETQLSDRELTGLLESSGIRIQALSDYYHDTPPEDVMHHLVVNYSGIDEEALTQALSQIQK